MQCTHRFSSCALLLSLAAVLSFGFGVGHVRAAEPSPAVTAPAAPAPADQKIDYVRQIKPLLGARCYSCHGVLEQKSGLRLDTAELMKKGGEGGPAIIPGHSADSPIVAALSGTGDTERMPLEGAPFTGEQIALVRTWIDQGAVAPPEKPLEDPTKHWAFQRPARAALPAIKNQGWVKNSIDVFIAAEHEKRGLQPAPATAKATLLRRVYLDLVGLPPTRTELLAFLADDSPDAYEKVVDRLLDSPHYGERWGRHWMDIWRYSDWDGYKEDIRESQRHIWHWRDWILESLNADKPYDRMIVEMLAADEVAPGDANALRATGFLVRNWYRFNRNVWMENTVEHTAKGFLGLTMNCARCHSHKYDPISQIDYYRFRAFFEPCDVRTDRLPGQPNVDQDGLPRIFDADATTNTYLLVRGDEAHPDKEHPLKAGLSRVLHEGDLNITPVSFAPPDYYPGLRNYVEQDEQSRADAELRKNQSELAAAAKKLADAGHAYAELARAGVAAPDTSAPAKPKTIAELAAAVKDAEQALVSAENLLAMADASAASVRARIAADRAAFAVPRAANAAELALSAGRAERFHTLCRHEQNLFVAAAQQQAAKKALKPGDANTKKKLAEADKKLSDLQQRRDTALAVLDEPNDFYTGFTDSYPKTSTGRRTALAQWIASKSNPLTARVAINHIWLRHFGSPLVPTVFDFGLNGKAPTHPELLDWLAVEFMENGWRMKPIHRLIVTSAAYHMQSAPSQSTAANVAIDPDNQFLWRANSRRMESEVVRDATLAVAGDLDGKLFGPDLDPDSGLKVPRRSIYFRSSKEKFVPFLSLFDRANVVDCYKRSESIVPQQALAMANSPLTLTESRRLAAKITGEVGVAKVDNASAFIAAAFEHVLSRAPSPQESAECAEFLRVQAARFAQPATLSKFSAPVEAAVQPSADAQQRAREDLVHVLLNHNDFITVR